MGAETKIEWTDRTWNPVRGCSRVSPGCDSCYAMGQAHRFSGPGKPFEGLTTIRRGKVDWSGVARFVPDMLDAPLRWRKPSRVFVNSMSDLFHHSLSNEEIAAVFGVMAACPQHTFQVLTKRAERMREWFGWVDRKYRGNSNPWKETVLLLEAGTRGVNLPEQPRHGYGWPLPNVWLGVSAEDQQRADERIPHLLETPAAVRFVSAEPLLGPIDLRKASHGYGGILCLNWAIVGGESGPGARPCDIAWIRSVVEQCRDAGIPCFVKQLGANPVPLKPLRLPSWHVLTGRPHRGWINDEPFAISDPKGGDPAEWPVDLRVRQFPESRP